MQAHTLIYANTYINVYIYTYLHTHINTFKNKGADHLPSATYYNKFGENFAASEDTRHLYKKGILKRATVAVSRGEYDRGYKLICEEFNVASLKFSSMPKKSEKDMKKFIRQRIAMNMSSKKKKREADEM